MASLDLLIAAWDEGHREFNIALEGLPDKDVWVRPHEKLLSIGEIAGHLAYYEAVYGVGPAPENLSDLPIKSVLISRDFQYYTSNIGQPLSLDLTSETIQEEVSRIHDFAKSHIESLDPEFDDPVPGSPTATWGGYVQYLAFHVAYHTGQIYSGRHMLGHIPEDN